MGCTPDLIEPAARHHGHRFAGDLTAEVFAAALHGAARYRPLQPTARAWLFTIARNTLATSVRRHRVEALAGIDGLLARLEALPREQREAIEARVLDERDYPEIAVQLDCSEPVVRKRVSRGLAKLRQQLEPRETS